MKSLNKALVSIAALLVLGLLSHDLWFRLTLAEPPATDEAAGDEPAFEARADGASPWAGPLSSSLALQAQIDAAFVRSQGAPSEHTDELARRMLHDEPLNARSLIYRALRLEADGDDEAALAGMTLAAQRDPRNLALLKWRAMHAAQSGDTDAVLTALAKLFELDRDNRNLYLDALEAVSLSPESRASLAEWVARSDSPAIPRLVSELNASHPDLALLFELNIAAPQAQAAFLKRLVDAQDYDLAYLAWLQFLPPSALGDLETPYDGGFRGKEGHRPFNWAIRSAQAELLLDGGLTVTHFGRNTISFANQIIRLTPGDYELLVQASGRTEARGSYFRWEIRCLPDTTQLIATLDFLDMTEAQQTFSQNFTAPGEGCSFQRLQLVGVAGEYPRWSRLTTTRIDIEPQRASEGAEP